MTTRHESLHIPPLAILIESTPYRLAAHADSWYTGNKRKLDAELTRWMAAVPETEGEFTPPIKGCKAIIGPHAGFAYSGPVAAYAYKSIDTTGIKRVFILGPSHHVYLDGCAVSTCLDYDTPLGVLPLDRQTIQELEDTGKFSQMKKSEDEAEHSIEMHLPYIRKVFEGMDIEIVPILVGSINHEKEAAYGKLLAPYLARKDTFCAVSTDFCHWGSRFSYTSYYPQSAPCGLIRLSQSKAAAPDFPIHESIAALDTEAMDLLTLPSSSAADAHANFASYLSRTKNTICGRHPIGVLLGALTAIEEEAEDKTAKLEWVKYAQSSECHTIRDSSVSYASAYVCF